MITRAGKGLRAKPSLAVLRAKVCSPSTWGLGEASIPPVHRGSPYAGLTAKSSGIQGSQTVLLPEGFPGVPFPGWFSGLSSLTSSKNSKAGYFSRLLSLWSQQQTKQQRARALSNPTGYGRNENPGSSSALTTQSCLVREVLGVGVGVALFQLKRLIHPGPKWTKGRFRLLQGRRQAPSWLFLSLGGHARANTTAQ